MTTRKTTTHNTAKTIFVRAAGDMYTIRRAPSTALVVPEFFRDFILEAYLEELGDSQSPEWDKKGGARRHVDDHNKFNYDGVTIVVDLEAIREAGLKVAGRLYSALCTKHGWKRLGWKNGTGATFGASILAALTASTVEEQLFCLDGTAAGPVVSSLEWESEEERNALLTAHLGLNAKFALNNGETPAIVKTMQGLYIDGLATGKAANKVFQVGGRTFAVSCWNTSGSNMKLDNAMMRSPNSSSVEELAKLLGLQKNFVSVSKVFRTEIFTKLDIAKLFVLETKKHVIVPHTEEHIMAIAGLVNNQQMMRLLEALKNNNNHATRMVVDARNVDEQFLFECEGFDDSLAHLKLGENFNELPDEFKNSSPFSNETLMENGIYAQGFRDTLAATNIGNGQVISIDLPLKGMHRTKTAEELAKLFGLGRHVCAVITNVSVINGSKTVDAETLFRSGIIQFAKSGAGHMAMIEQIRWGAMRIVSEVSQFKSVVAYVDPKLERVRTMSELQLDGVSPTFLMSANKSQKFGIAAKLLEVAGICKATELLKALFHVQNNSATDEQKVLVSMAEQELQNATRKVRLFDGDLHLELEIAVFKEDVMASSFYSIEGLKPTNALKEMQLNRAKKDAEKASAEGESAAGSIAAMLAEFNAQSSGITSVNVNEETTFGDDINGTVASFIIDAIRANPNAPVNIMAMAMVENGLAYRTIKPNNIGVVGIDSLIEQNGHEAVEKFIAQKCKAHKSAKYLMSHHFSGGKTWGMTLKLIDEKYQFVGASGMGNIVEALKSLFAGFSNTIPSSTVNLSHFDDKSVSAKGAELLDEFYEALMNGRDKWPGLLNMGGNSIAIPCIDRISEDGEPLSYRMSKAGFIAITLPSAEDVKGVVKKNTSPDGVTTGVFGDFIVNTLLSLVGMANNPKKAGMAIGGHLTAMKYKKEFERRFMAFNLFNVELPNSQNLIAVPHIRLDDGAIDTVYTESRALSRKLENVGIIKYPQVMNFSTRVLKFGGRFFNYLTVDEAVVGNQQDSAGAIKLARKALHFSEERIVRMPVVHTMANMDDYDGDRVTVFNPGELKAVTISDVLTNNVMLNARMQYIMDEVASAHKGVSVAATKVHKFSAVEFHEAGLKLLKEKRDTGLHTNAMQLLMQIIRMAMYPVADQALFDAQNDANKAYLMSKYAEKAMNPKGNAMLSKQQADLVVAAFGYGVQSTITNMKHDEKNSDFVIVSDLLNGKKSGADIDAFGAMVNMMAEMLGGFKDGDIYLSKESVTNTAKVAVIAIQKYLAKVNPVVAGKTTKTEFIDHERIVTKGLGVAIDGLSGMSVLDPKLMGRMAQKTYVEKGVCAATPNKDEGAVVVKEFLTEFCTAGILSTVAKVGEDVGSLADLPKFKELHASSANFKNSAPCLIARMLLEEAAKSQGWATPVVDEDADEASGATGGEVVDLASQF